MDNPTANWVDDEEIGGVAVVYFTEHGAATAFKAEYTILDNDIVFHFFPPEQLAAWLPVQQVSYWKEWFPHHLEQIACDHFGTTDPSRLKAAYAEELVSWWLRAYKCNVLNPELFAIQFLHKLHEAMLPCAPSL